MDPHNVFCPNPTCPATPQINEGNISIHSRHPQRYRCNLCQKTFSARKGTPLYRRRTPEATIALVLTLIAYGCPLAAIEAAFGFQRRTVQQWVDAAGEHCQRIHEHLVLKPRDLLEHVQADELRVKAQGGVVVWMAMALMVSTRLWLGGAISASRDKALIRRVVDLVRACASAEHALLVATDGLTTYVKAWGRAFRSKHYTGRVGAPRLIAWPKVVIGQVIKRYERRRVVGVERRLAKGSSWLLERLLERTQGGGVLNTAYIERLNATFRARLAALVRRTRGLARRHRRLHTGMYLVGTVYNFCCYHASLSTTTTNDSSCSSGLTPAMAAGITSHRWSMAEVLEYDVPPGRWQPPKQRGRRSKAMQQLIDRWAA